MLFSKDYKKDINILYKEIKNLNRYLSTIKLNNMTECKSIILDLFNNILTEKNISIQFQIYLQQLYFYYKNKLVYI